MISECLHDIHEKTNIEYFYNQESPNNLPPLIICKDKLLKQNKGISDYNLMRQDDDDECSLPINIRNQINATQLHKGYSKNIDVDSELRGINYYQDKCFYDNYKVNPKKFNCHKELFEKQENDLNYMKNMVNYNLNLNYNINDNCIPKPGHFPQCPQSNFNPLPKNDNKALNTNLNQSVKYSFNNEGYCRDFSCQKLFNNFTKRVTYSNDSKELNINPECLDCNYRR